MKTSEAIRILIQDVEGGLSDHEHIMHLSHVLELKWAITKAKRQATRLEKEGK